MLSLFGLVQLLSLCAAVSSFAFPSIAIPKPTSGASEVQKQAEAQTDVHLHIRLDVTDERSESCIMVDGPILTLEGDRVATDTIPMPGANGPRPHTSSGKRSLRTMKPGTYITMDGTQVMKMEKGCWEIVWRDNELCGALVFGFNVPEEAVRNNAKIPKCRMYVSFPLYTEQSLEKVRTEKKEAERRAQEFANEKKAELAKVDTTNNLIAKALHYRNAFAAMEQYYLTGISSFPQLPSDQGFLPLQDDLLVETRGKIWQKGSGVFDKHTLLGNAQIMPGLRP